MKKGFTVLELTIVLGIIAFILGFSFISFNTAQTKNDLASTLDVILSDIKEQQLKAMVTDTEGRASNFNYGIHFDSNKYTLFHCAASPSCTYDSSDTTNFPVKLDQTTQFTSVTFPSANLVFSQTTGKVLNFVQGQNTFIIKNISSGEQKTVTINLYGVITQVN